MTYLPPLNGGRINATISGNTAGAGALISSGTLSLAGGNNITLSQAGNAITISAPNAVAQSNQTVGLYGLGNTTQNSSTTLDARSLSFNGLGAATVGYSNGSIQLSVPTQTVQTQNMVSVLGSTGNISFANGNNVTFGGNASTVTASASFNQTNQTVGLYGLGNTTQNSSTTLDARSLSFNGLGGATVGYSNGSIQISGAQTVAQTNQTVGLYGLGNTTQNSSTTLDARSLSFNGLGAATVGYSNGSIQLSVPTQTVQTQNLMTVNGTQGNVSISGGANVTVGNNASTITISAAAQTVQTQNLHNLTLSGNTAGAMAQVSSGTLTLAGGNNITLSQAGNAITISAGAGGGGVAIANSQTTYTSGTANFIEGGGAITIASTTGQSFNISVPQTSSLSATGGVSISSNGSTISIGAPAAGTVSNWEPLPLPYGSLTNTQLGNGSVYFFKIQPEAFVNASQLLQLASVSLSSSSNSSHAGALSIAAGIFTANGSTLSLITQSSGSASYQWTNTSNNSMNSVSGLRGLSIPLNVSMSEGHYWLGMWSRSSTTNANWFTASNMVFTNQSVGYMGLMGQASNNTQGIQEGVGVWSASSAAMPASVAMSQITQSNLQTNAMPYVAFNNQTW